LSPFGGVDDSQTSENIKKCEVKFPGEGFSGISENAHDFIRKLLVKNKASRLNVYEALEHPWLAEEDNNEGYHIPSSKYDNIRNKIREKYASWPEPCPALGRIANYSSLRKLRPKEYSIYSTYFDRRDANPRFVRRPRNQNVLEGQTATFSCIILAVSPPVVTWYQGGNEIRQSVKYLKKYSRNSYILEVKRCTLDDKGEFIIRAVNSYGEREYNVFLNVEPLPKEKPAHDDSHELRQKRAIQEMQFDLWKEPDEKATITFKLRPRLIQVGIGCKLLCCIAGKPLPKVQWFKNSKELSETDSHYSFEYSCGVCTLEIASCSLTDAGSYRCRAENSLGFDETECQVNVEEVKIYKPRALVLEQGGTVTPKRLSVVNPPEPPKFIRKFVTFKLVPVGDTVTLKASFSGVPAPNVEWLRNGEAISAKHINISSTNEESTLVINKIQSSDEGEYSCRIRNIRGIDVHKCQIELEKQFVPSFIEEAQVVQKKPERKPTEKKPPRAPPKVEEPVKQQEPIQVKEEKVTEDKQEQSAEATAPASQPEPEPVQVAEPKPEPVVVVEEKKPEPAPAPVETKPAAVKKVEQKPKAAAAPVDKKPVEKKAEVKKVEEKPKPAAAAAPAPAPAQTPESVAIAEPEPVPAQLPVVKEVVSNEPKLSFVRHLISQNLVESDPLVLEAEVSGKEPLELVWLRNGKEIPENPDFIKEKKGNVYSLTVTEIFPEDSGVFSAELFNESTNQTLISSCSIVVKGFF
jgi:hypothetical protein